MDSVTLSKNIKQFGMKIKSLRKGVQETTSVCSLSFMETKTCPKVTIAARVICFDIAMSI